MKMALAALALIASTVSNAKPVTYEFTATLLNDVAGESGAFLPASIAAGTVGRGVFTLDDASPRLVGAEPPINFLGALQSIHFRLPDLTFSASMVGLMALDGSVDRLSMGGSGSVTATRYVGGVPLYGHSAGSFWSLMWEGPGTVMALGPSDFPGPAVFTSNDWSTNRFSFSIANPSESNVELLFGNMTVQGPVLAVPEPISLAMFVPGLLLVGAACLRRQKPL